MFSRILKNLRCSRPDSPLHRLGDIAYSGTNGCACCAHVRLLALGVVIGALVGAALMLAIALSLGDV